MGSLSEGETWGLGEEGILDEQLLHLVSCAPSLLVMFRGAVSPVLSEAKNC